MRFFRAGLVPSREFPNVQECIVSGFVMGALAMLQATLPKAPVKVVKNEVVGWVEATKTVLQGELHLVPQTPIVTLIAPDSAISQGFMYVHVPVHLSMKLACLGPPAVAEEHVPAWIVRRTSNFEEANMELRRFPVEIVTKARQERLTFNIRAPVLVNRKDVRAGEELVLYQPPPLPARPSSAQDSEGLTMKRHRAAD